MELEHSMILGWQPLPMEVSTLLARLLWHRGWAAAKSTLTPTQCGGHACEERDLSTSLLLKLTAVRVSSGASAVHVEVPFWYYCLAAACAVVAMCADLGRRGSPKEGDPVGSGHPAMWKALAAVLATWDGFMQEFSVALKYLPPKTADR